MTLTSTGATVGSKPPAPAPVHRNSPSSLYCMGKAAPFPDKTVTAPPPAVSRYPFSGGHPSLPSSNASSAGPSSGLRSTGVPQDSICTRRDLLRFPPNTVHPSAVREASDPQNYPVQASAYRDEPARGYLREDELPEIPRSVRLTQKKLKQAIVPGPVMTLFVIHSVSFICSKHNAFHRKALFSDNFQDST